MAVAAGKGAGGGRSRGGAAGSSAAAAATVAPPFSRGHALLSALLSLMAGLRGGGASGGTGEQQQGALNQSVMFTSFKLNPSVFLFMLNRIAPSAPEPVLEVSGVLTSQYAWDGKAADHQMGHRCSS